MPKQDEDKDAQIKRFIETARQLECDEDTERFEEKLKQLAKPTQDRGKRRASSSRVSRRR